MTTTDGNRPAPLIELKDVGLVYGEPGTPQSVVALSEVDFSVDENQFISIIGPSGCGKSTLLKIVAGLLPATRGDVLVDGNSPDAARKGQQFGFVFQSPVLLPWRTAAENVALLLETRGVPRRERDEIVQRHLNLVGLSGFENHRIRQLSGGMQQRVSIARALSLDPAILLMDEPFGALDAITRDRMGLELLRIWQQRRKTVLFVTHSVSEAVLLSDVVIVLTARPGRIKSTYDIELPRPRTQEIRMSQEFIEYTHRLVQDLEIDQPETTEAS